MEESFGEYDMDLNKMYIEEDLFPREIALYEKRSYGLLDGVYL